MAFWEEREVLVIQTGDLLHCGWWNLQVDNWKYVIVKPKWTCSPLHATANCENNGRNLMLHEYIDAKFKDKNPKNSHGVGDF